MRKRITKQTVCPFCGATKEENVTTTTPEADEINSPKLKQLLIELRCSLLKLSALSGVSKYRISMCINGYQPLRISEVYKIKEVLDKIREAQSE